MMCGGLDIIEDVGTLKKKGDNILGEKRLKGALKN